MSTKDSAGVQSTGTTRTIEGPIPEFDRYGEPTGYDYYVCSACGREAMRRRDLSGCCRAARSEGA